MSQDFRDCFVGEKGYDTIRQQMKSGNEFLTDAAKCFQERSDAEAIYARALRKNSDTLQKLSGRAKGSLANAFKIFAEQTSKESDAHSTIASVLLNDISIPMKNLAETQYKDRKLIEETLNGKFKEWNSRKDCDAKYRLRQFELSKEIETLHLKASEMTKTTKSSSKDTSKENIISTPLVMSCVLPGGRYASASEKLDNTITKTEEELKRVETKYHNATRDVEYARQSCDAEMCRGCDQFQKMEVDRLTEMDKFIRAFANSIETLNEMTHQISECLQSTQISPEDDIIIQSRSNSQIAEAEILLYDIYAENDHNVMSTTRRKLSLQHWIEMLKNDIDAQKQSRNANISFSSSIPSNKSVEPESPDDDRFSSSDGAMCSRKGNVANNNYQRDGSSPSSNDDEDGGMYHSKTKKRERKKQEDGGGFSSGTSTNQQNVRFLLCLYEASLHKIESVYKRMQNLPESSYKHARGYTKTYNDKGSPTTFLRVPYQSLMHTSPSAPSTTKYFAEAMPMFPQPAMLQQPMVYATQGQAPPVGWANHIVQTESASAPDNPTVASVLPYPTLPMQSQEFSSKPPDVFVKAKYSFKAKHKDEINFEKGDIILLLERRSDEWYRGVLDGKTGLFPGNYVVEI